MRTIIYSVCIAVLYCSDCIAGGRGTAMTTGRARASKEFFVQLERDWNMQRAQDPASDDTSKTAFAKLPSTIAFREAIKQRLADSGAESVVLQFHAYVGSEAPKSQATEKAEPAGEAAPRDTRFAFIAGTEILRQLEPTCELKAITMLLTYFCPDEIAPGVLLESFLAFPLEHDCAESLPMVVLFDAFAQSGSPEVRRTIANAARRAFPQVPPEDNDAAFIAACRHWYIRNRPKSKLNDDYAHKAMNPAYQNEPLYVPLAKH